MKGRELMNLRNCRQCGQVFNYMAGNMICPKCREEAEKKFQEVKDYLREHKGSTINDIAEACDVDPQQVRSWLRGDRLEVTEDSAVYLDCEACGAPIRSGKYCDRCKMNLAKDFGSILDEGRRKNQPVEQKKSAKMRFL